jgi:deoxyadenosine/deoxycytidine kinase
MLVYLECSDEKLQQRLSERGETAINYNCLAEGNQHEIQNKADYISTGDIASLEKHIKIHFKLAET